MELVLVVTGILPGDFLIMQKSLPRLQVSIKNNSKKNKFKFYLLGIDAAVIKRCGAILQVLTSGSKINTEKFDTYCIETAKRLVLLYPWFYRPAAVHKVLMHGARFKPLYIRFIPF